MWEKTIRPRFCETDALGHINNAVFLEWFEDGREPMFRIFTPDLSIDNWKLILAKNTVEYLRPVALEHDVVLQTFFSKLGRSSMIVEHRLFQCDELVASGQVVMVRYDYQTNQSCPIEDDVREQLKVHFVG